MKKNIILKFIKADEYSNYLFCCLEDSEYLKSGYALAKIYYKKLRKKGYETNLPFYIVKKDKFATVRFKKNDIKRSFVKHAIYQIEFKMLQTTSKKGEKHVNLQIMDTKKISDFDIGLEIMCSDNDVPEDEDDNSEDDEN